MAPAKKDAAPARDGDEDRVDRAPPDEDLAELLSEMPQDATVQVRRVDGGKLEFIANMDALSLTEEYAAKHFGPGQYRCRYSWPDEQGKKAYRAHKSLAISEDAARRYGFYARNVREEEDAAPRTRGSRGDIVDAGIAGLLTASAEAMRAQREGGGGNNDILLAIISQNAENAKAQAAAQAAASERTTTVVTALIGAFAPLLTALVGRKGDDPLETATRIAEVMKVNAPASGGMKEALESLALVLDMKERLAGGDDGDDVPTALIKNFAGPFSKLVEAYAQRRDQPNAAQEIAVRDVPAPAAPPARLATPAASAPAAPVTAPSQPQSDADMMLAQLKAALRGWVELAKAKRDPRTYAQVTWDEFTSLPKPLRDIAVGFLAETVDGTDDGDFALETTAPTLVPEVALYPKWFQAFFDELRILAGIIDATDDDDLDPPVPPAPEGGP